MNLSIDNVDNFRDKLSAPVSDEPAKALNWRKKRRYSCLLNKSLSGRIGPQSHYRPPRGRLDPRGSSIAALTLWMFT